MKATQLFCVLIAGCGVTQGSAPDDGGAIGSGSGSGSGSATTPVHTPGMFFGSVLDERNDAIDFSGGAPVHTHGGAPIDLSTNGCPAIYKYAYLEGAQAPAFGAETTPNPLAWQITSDVTSLDPAGTSYRVRDEANDVLLDWTLMTPDADGIYTIDLRRDGTHGVPAIGTQSGPMYVDARFRDTQGADSIKSTCWDNHPLAAPLQIGAPTAGDLFGMTFALHSYISRVMNAGSYDDDHFGVQVVNLMITQPTAEPTTFTLATSEPTGTGTKDAVDTYIAVDSYATSLDCGSFACPGITAATRTTTSTPIDGTWQLTMFDLSTGAVLCRSSAANPFAIACVIPGRAPGTAAHGYGATLTLSGERSISPFVAAIAENTFTDEVIGATPTWFSGMAVNPGMYTKACSQNVRSGSGVFIEYTCTAYSDYTHVLVANQAKIAFDAIQLTLTTAAGDTSTAISPPYLGPLVFAAKTWDAGNDGF